MAGWGVAVLWVFASRATTDSVFPILIWSYGVATGPWSFLASKDQQAGGNEYSVMALFFLQVGYVIAAVLVVVVRTFPPAILALVAAMTVNWILQVLTLRAQMRAEAVMGEL